MENKYIELPIIEKGKIKNKKNFDDKSRKLTIILIILIILFLLICGHSMAKIIEKTMINAKGEIAKPILEIENDPSIDITALKNVGTYSFKIKNYNSKNEITETNLKYFIEILSNLDDSVSIELLENGTNVKLTDGKTNYIEIANNKKITREYQIKVKYNKDDKKSMSDILEKIQIKVHTEQVKA